VCCYTTLWNAEVVFWPFTTVNTYCSACVSSEYHCRPQYYWKSTVTRLTTSCGVCFASESTVPRSRMLTNWNDASTKNGPLCVTLSLNVRSASGVSVSIRLWNDLHVYGVGWGVKLYSLTRLRACVRPGSRHYVTRVTFFQTVTASHVCRYRVNHSTVHLIIALTTQTLLISQGSYFRWSRHFIFILWRVYSWTFLRLRNDLYCVGWGVKLYSLTHSLTHSPQDIPTNFHWNQFMFDKPRAKDNLAPFSRHGVKAEEN